MKRLSPFILILSLLGMAFPSLAQTQNPDLITLDDATPAIDVVITLPADTTGTIALDLAQAGVTLTDSNNAVVFYATDERVHGIEFNIAPNSGTHTLTVERLPNVTQAYVGVVSLPEMTVQGDVQFVEGVDLTLNQEATLSLNADNPGGTFAVNIPADTTGVITATFPGASAMTQLVDSDGVVLAETAGGHVDGLTYVLDAGDYDLTILGSNIEGTVVAGIRTVSAEVGGFNVVEAPTATATDQTIATTAENCTATVSASSANLRSGPGTGYSVLGYVYRGENYVVGGQNPENNWLVIGMADGSTGWLSNTVANLQGSCTDLTVFNIPLREAAPAQIIITSPNNNNSYDDYDDDDYEEYEDHDDDHQEYEHEEYEHEDDD